MTSLAKDLEPHQELYELAPTASAVQDLEPNYQPMVAFSTHRGNGSLDEGSDSDTSHTVFGSLPAEPDTTVPNAHRPEPRVIPLPRIRPAVRNRFIPLQKWEGIVLSLDDEIITARLVDKTSNQPDEEAEIPLSDVTGDDLPLVCPGAVFYWTIGYSVDLTGSRRRVAEMRFRRLPAWTKRELKQARQSADRTIEALGWNE